MGLSIVEASDAINIPIMIVGFVYFLIRVICMRAFILSEDTAESLWVEGEYERRFNGWFSPVIHHTSYYISLLMALAMIFSFRVKVLNIVSVAMLPSIIVTVPFKDIPILLHPEKHGTKRGSLYWWNYATIHIPMIFIAIYMFITMDYTLSILAYWMAIAIVIGLFLALDDKDNGVLSGAKYIKVALAMLVVWSLITHLLIFPFMDGSSDPLIAPVIRFVLT